jgi:hypothetical protein
VSDTPETDASVLHDGTVVSADMARKLERERRTARNLADAALWESDRLRSKLRKACAREEKLVCERDSTLTENKRSY